MAIWTDQTLKVKAGTILTKEYWIAQAKGVQDEYGNPFRVITLRWNYTSIHKMAEFGKTVGFEDAIIGRASGTGGLKVRYRSPGSLTWNRPIGGVGDFQALCPVTPKNMKKLASCFPNKMWRIIDDDIRKIVESMWTEKWDAMDEKTKNFNEKWFKMMHTLETDRGKKGTAEAVNLEIEKKSIADENLEISRKKQEQDLREAKLNEKEKELVDQQVIAVKDGKEVFKISERSLRKMKLHELKKVFRKLGIPDGDSKKTSDMPEMIATIIEKQGGDPEVKKEGSGLED